MSFILQNTEMGKCNTNISSKVYIVSSCLEIFLKNINLTGTQVSRCLIDLTH